MKTLFVLFILFTVFATVLPAQEQKTVQNGHSTGHDRHKTPTLEMSFGVRPADFDQTQEPVNPPARLIEPLDVRYPDDAVRTRLEGTAIIATAVDNRGNVFYLELRSSSGHPSLDSAALSAVKEGLFKPAQRGGKTVSSRITIPVEFRLSREKEDYDSQKSIEELEQDKRNLEKTKQQLRSEQEQLEEEIKRLKQQQKLKDK